MTFKSSFALVLALGVSAASRANDSVIWDNMPSGPGVASFASQLDTVYPFDGQVADDFRLRDQNPGADATVVVTGVAWTGRYWNGLDEGIDGFNILIYEDAGDMPPGGPNDPSALAVYSAFVAFADAGETVRDAAEHIYDYSAKLAVPFEADTDAVYWIAVQAEVNFPPQWGMMLSEDLQGTQAHHGLPALGVNYWTPISANYGEQADTAFRLLGDAGGATDANLTEARSIRNHGGVELAIDLVANNGIEPRLGGANLLEFAFDQDIDGLTADCANVQFDCAVGGAPVCSAVTLAGDDRTLIVDLAASPADINCCIVSFDGVATTTGGGVADAFALRILSGDIDASGGVTGGDFSIVKPHFGEIAGVNLVAPQFDFDASGGVTGGDASQIKPRFGNIAPVCE